jgi:hypothetical protein
MSGHFFKLHFCMFDRSQMKYNSLDCPIFWEIVSIIYKVYISSLTQIKNVFACSRHSNLESGQSLFFFQTSFFYQMCTIPCENKKGF